MALGITISVGGTIVFGEAVHFTSAVTGENGAVTYQWKVDDENAGGTDNEATFTFTPVGIGNATITCEVTDETPDTVESSGKVVTTKSLYETMQGTLSYLAKIAKAV